MLWDLSSFIAAFLVYFSPIILLIGFLNMKYELTEDELILIFYGMKFRKIKYEDIESLKLFNQYVFKKGKLANIPFNKAIRLKLKSPNVFKRAFVIAPKNREEFVKKLEAKIKK